MLTAEEMALAKAAVIQDTGTAPCSLPAATRQEL